MRFNTITLGCKVNLYETESLIEYLVNMGFTYDENGNNLDLCIINTCTVTATSDQKSRQMIRQMRKKNPNAIIVAMGCFVQTHQEDAKEIADIILGTKDRLKIYDLILEYQKCKNKINYVSDVETFVCYDEMKLSRLTNHTRGFVKIQDGCENFCSYCLIPYARGKIKSRRAEDVIAEIEQLTMFGVKEVIIAGINTGTYGQDTNDINLAKLIEMIMEKTTLWRLRLSSIELMEVTDELLMTMKKYEFRIANHLHIPLQGGCDNTLIRMKRKYLTKDYYNLISKIRSIFPTIAITTDCLAGFVGESEIDFLDSMTFIKSIGFANMHIFPYSRRKGTAADLMEDHLNSTIIKERAKTMIKLASDMKLDYEKQFIGKEFDVLIEQKKNNLWIGHTSNYLEVNIKNQINDLTNKIVKCKIDEIKNGKIFATIEGGKNENI